MGLIEHPERDDLAVKVAEALWPQRYMGDLTRAEWERCYAVVDAANDQLRRAVEAGAALYACLRDGHSLGDEAVHDAMTRWEAANPQRPGGQ